MKEWHRNDASLGSSHCNFLVLLATTPVSILLLYSSINNISFSGIFYGFIASDRPTVQLVVQLIANLLSLWQVLVLRRLINYGTRRRLAGKGMSLDGLRASIDAMVPAFSWDEPPQYLVPLMAFGALSMALSAVWAAALTPTTTLQATNGLLMIPGWENVSFVKEYPSEVGSEGPTVRTSLGTFSYSVGMQLLGSLLASAASATPIDGSLRHHTKLQSSGFTFIGRSYGVGSSVGLMDSDILLNDLTTEYAYQESGYNTGIQCIYNKTSDFAIEPTDESFIYAARGQLPDSDNGEEYSDYIGHDTDRIVAIGVAHFASPNVKGSLPPRKYLAFAAGSTYSFLDKVQCKFDFVPTRFNITVSTIGRNVTVLPTTDANVEDIDSTWHLKSTTVRQFELITNDETNMYVSVVGAALNQSISDMRMYTASSMNSTKKGSISDADVVLRAIEQSLTAMTDDMLVAYGAAQLMVGNFKQPATATMRNLALSFGNIKFSVAVFVVNTIVVLIMISEFVRTRAWRGVPDFDVADVRQVIVAAWLARGDHPQAARSLSGKSPLGEIHIRYSREESQLVLGRPNSMQEKTTSPI